MKLSLSETEDIIGRLKEALDVKSDGQLAKYLGITRQNIGAARKRDDVPPGWIYRVAELSGYSMDWLRFGHVCIPTFPIEAKFLKIKNAFEA